MTVFSMFGMAPLIVATVADERRTALFAGTALAFVVGIGWWQGNAWDGAYWTRVAVVCAIGAMAVVAAGIRRRREERLARMTAIAEASQLALLPPLPPEMTAMPAMEQVAGQLSQAIGPHLGEEDFVTAVLAQITSCGDLAIVNCGHHPPLLCHRGGLQPLADRETTLPLGLENDFTAFNASWAPGDRLLLYTDGLVESRDQHRNFLPEKEIAAALLSADCEQALDTLLTAARRHTGGHGDDDMALLLLEHGTPSRSSPNGHPAAPAPGQDGIAVA